MSSRERSAIVFQRLTVSRPALLHGRKCSGDRRETGTVPSSVSASAVSGLNFDCRKIYFDANDFEGHKTGNRFRHSASQPKRPAFARTS